MGSFVKLKGELQKNVERRGDIKKHRAGGTEIALARNKKLNSSILCNCVHVKNRKSASRKIQ